MIYPAWVSDMRMALIVSQTEYASRWIAEMITNKKSSNVSKSFEHAVLSTLYIRIKVQELRHFVQVTTYIIAVVRTRWAKPPPEWVCCIIGCFYIMHLG